MICAFEYFLQPYCFLFILVARGKTCSASPSCNLKHKMVINSFLVIVVFVVCMFERERGGLQGAWELDELIRLYK